MQKLAKVHLRTDFDPHSEDPQFSGPVLVAGSGRTKPQNGGTYDPLTATYEPNPPLPVTDVELEDDPISRRVWVRSPGSVRFVPYEMVRFGEPMSAFEQAMREEIDGLNKAADEADARALASRQAPVVSLQQVSTLSCSNCGKLFPGPKGAQELGGHRRHCKGAA